MPALDGEMRIFILFWKVTAVDQFPAHIRISDSGEENIQTALEHCENAARYASQAPGGAGLAAAGELIDLVHDAGKMTAAFSRYISLVAKGSPVRRGSVNHTFAGVRLLFERYYRPGGASLRNMACEILAFASGSHHGQFDCIDPDGRDGFSHRLDMQGIGYPEARENFSDRTDPDRLDGLFEAAHLEVERIIARCRDISKGQGEMLFHVSMLCRLLLSGLIDADRRDTAEFMHDTHFARAPDDMRPIWASRLAVMEEKLDAFSSARQIDRVRQKISLQCRGFEGEREGVYRLSVPTGGGKTLSALRFALSAAQRHNKRRILFVIPLLSVLEQNAAELRRYLDADDMILEHHSNAVRPEARAEELDIGELLTENWHAPVIVTTLVQLLNTLFDGGTTCIRRMAALTDSVIVIDEIQSLPRKMLSQFNLAVNFLSKVCHATVVLCSATQPCLENVEHPLYRNPPEIVPRDPDSWRVFRRTDIINRHKLGGYTAGEMAGLLLEALPEAKSVLLVCNKKSQAEQVYRNLSGAGAPVFHLSASMCMAHRVAVLAQIKGRLEAKEPLICVATQLVEAGVDISFGCVFRAAAGMDNVVQAAGRCNRSGEFDGLRPVYIVNFSGEDLSRLNEIQQAQIAAKELLDSFGQDSGPFEGDLQSDASIGYYYRRLLCKVPRDAQDYPVPKYKTTLYQMLSMNGSFRPSSGTAASHPVGQAFKTAGQIFEVFDSSAVDVLVHYGEGAGLITDLCSERAKRDLRYCKELLERAKAYTVSLFSYQQELLAKNGGLQKLYCGEDSDAGPRILAVQPQFYHSDTGISLDGGSHSFLEG